MASGRPLNILSSLDEAEEWHKQPYIRRLPKKFKPFEARARPPLPRVMEQHPLAETSKLVSFSLET